MNPLLDGIDETAAECGSVNIVTISNNGSTLVGHNTDGDGLINALRETGAGLSGSQSGYCMPHSLGLIKNRTDLFSGFWERPVLRK